MKIVFVTLLDIATYTKADNAVNFVYGQRLHRARQTYELSCKYSSFKYGYALLQLKFIETVGGTQIMFNRFCFFFKVCKKSFLFLIFVLISIICTLLCYEYNLWPEYVNKEIINYSLHT